MNKRLARRYYGVCGNKYTSCIEPLEHTSDDRAPEFGDSLHKDWSFDSMTKKRFSTDCTLVSHERNWDVWVKQVLPDHKFHANATKGDVTSVPRSVGALLFPVQLQPTQCN